MASSDPVSIRPANPGDAGRIARIWWAGWQEAHHGAVPDELVTARTEESFVVRARENVARTAVAEVDGVVAGFVTVVDDEVEQLYLDREHRGGGVASTLLSEGERLVARNGHGAAWLAVVAANTRARRFYARRGWVDEGPFARAAPGGITVPAHRYVRALGDDQLPRRGRAPM